MLDSIKSTLMSQGALTFHSSDKDLRGVLASPLGSFERTTVRGVDSPCLLPKRTKGSIEKGSSSLRLNQGIDRALYVQPIVRQYNYRLWKLGSQGAELYYSPKGWTRGGGCAIRASSVVDKSANRERAARRARGQIRRAVLAHKLQYMWTLTFRAEVTELSEAWAAFTRYSRRLRRLAPEARYVVVPELQRRGVWHFHMLTDVRVDFQKMSRCWGHGFAFVSWGNSRHAASYACKYISKTFQDAAEGDHRYRRSRGLAVDVFEGKGDLEEAWAMAEAEAGHKLLPTFVFVDESGAQFFMLDESEEVSDNGSAGGGRNGPDRN